MRLILATIVLGSMMLGPAMAKGKPYQNPFCPSGPVTWSKAEAAKHPSVKYDPCVVVK